MSNKVISWDILLTKKKKNFQKYPKKLTNEDVDLIFIIYYMLINNNLKNV